MQEPTPNKSNKAKQANQPKDEVVRAEDLHSETPLSTAEANSEEPIVEAAPETTKIKIEFPYSDLVRAKVPKVFDVAETVANEWTQDGNFEEIPMGNPIAQVLVGKSLRKAKDFEKEVVKVVEANPKLNEIKNQVVEKANLAKATLQILLKK